MKREGEEQKKKKKEDRHLGILISRNWAFYEWHFFNDLAHKRSANLLTMATTHFFVKSRIQSQEADFFHHYETLCKISHARLILSRWFFNTFTMCATKKKTVSKNSHQKLSGTYTTYTKICCPSCDWLQLHLLLVWLWVTLRSFSCHRICLRKRKIVARFAYIVKQYCHRNTYISLVELFFGITRSETSRVTLSESVISLEVSPPQRPSNTSACARAKLTRGFIGTVSGSHRAILALCARARVLFVIRFATRKSIRSSCCKQAR